VELRKAYEANIAVGKPPYADVEINTRGALNWIIQERNWTDKGGSPNFLDLRGSLMQANLVLQLQLGHG
jgi:hypothetical protein